jgi:ribose transport system ATP-binding protein
VHQDPGVFPLLTVAENMAIGSADGFPTTAIGGIGWRRLRERTRALLERYEIDARPDDVLGELRPADHTMIAIARALQGDGRGEDADEDVSLLVLDEPTASLPEHEVELLLDALRRYARAGFAILYVSHRLDEVLSVVDDVTVLRNGRHVITRDADGLTQDELIEHIVGRPLERVFAETSEQHVADPVLEVSHLRGGPLRDVGFRVRRGEVLGIAGLLGSGRTELLRMIFGAHPIDGGELTLDGRRLRPRTPEEAMRLGIAYVPEHRLLDAAFPDLSVRENLSAAQIGRYWGRRGFQHARERHDARTSIDDFSIRTDGDRALFSSLSGGNQQKVVLARWLRRNPRLLLLDEPTQGVDVGARADVYAAVRAAVLEGMAAILVASDLEELAHVSDRVLVLREGRIVAELSGGVLEAHRLTELMLAEEREAA